MADYRVIYTDGSSEIYREIDQVSIQVGSPFVEFLSDTNQTVAVISGAMLRRLALT